MTKHRTRSRSSHFGNAAIASPVVMVREGVSDQQRRSRYAGAQQNKDGDRSREYRIRTAARAYDKALLDAAKRENICS